MSGTLTMRQAATLYGIPNSTISRWVRAGIIRRVESGTRGQRALIMERDVIVASKHYRPGPGRGRRAAMIEAIARDLSA